MSSIFLEAVSVCVGYSDFLEQIIPFNRGCFDRWLIVTSHEDSATKEVCRKHNLEFLATDDFTNRGDEFNKGAGVDRGLALLSHKGWVLHMDSDIVLPRDFRESLEDAHLDPTCIYGVDRYMVKGWDAWQKLKNSGWLQRDYHYRSNTHPGFQIGTRWCDIHFGYVPLGCFSLWNGSSDLLNGIRTKRYPRNHSDACRTDIKHGLAYDRRHRVLIPEIIVAHLESEANSKMGINWKGRQSRWFGPEKGK